MPLDPPAEAQGSLAESMPESMPQSMPQSMPENELENEVGADERIPAALRKKVSPKAAAKKHSSMFILTPSQKFRTDLF